jgi:hypothetical protein
MKSHSVPIGVQHSSKSFWALTDEGTFADTSIYNEKDIWSPNRAFGTESFKGKGIALLMDPFVDNVTALPDGAYGTTLAMDPFTYGFAALTTFFSTLLYCLFVVGSRHVLALGGNSAQAAALYMAFIAAASWYALVRFFAFDKRIQPSLFMNIEFGKWCTLDNTGVVSFAILSGLMFGAGALAGVILSAMGFNSAAISENIAVDSNIAFLLFFSSLIVGAYVFCRKLQFPAEKSSKNWNRVTGATTLMIFLVVLLGLPYANLYQRLSFFCEFLRSAKNYKKTGTPLTRPSICAPLWPLE